ncbi:hypothetical protein MHH81_20795 [Psychrobacillus sp. FSL H8-0484]|uniref:hypothetical protein n=1 Tax=Psychrobacillus sp. FSL H8-0484 TaxID=2921390 RepID=UPI0030F4C3FC
MAFFSYFEYWKEDKNFILERLDRIMIVKMIEQVGGTVPDSFSLVENDAITMDYDYINLQSVSDFFTYSKIGVFSILTEDIENEQLTFSIQLDVLNQLKKINLTEKEKTRLNQLINYLLGDFDENTNAEFKKKPILKGSRFMYQPISFSGPSYEFCNCFINLHKFVKTLLDEKQVKGEFTNGTISKAS